MNIVEKIVLNKINRSAWKKVMKEQKIPEFIGDKNNPMEVYEYISKYNIEPIETITNEDRTYTNIYENGLEICVKNNFFNEKNKTKIKKIN